MATVIQSASRQTAEGQLSFVRNATNAMHPRGSLRFFLEWLRHDCSIVRQASALAGYFGAKALLGCSKCYLAARMLAKVHGSGYSDVIARWIEEWFRNRNDAGQLAKVYQQHVASQPVTPLTNRFWKEPTKLFGPMVTVLKSPADNEKGVVLLNYSYVYPLFAKLFDVPAIAKRYHFVLEPSWCGSCELSILAYTMVDGPVFVESTEPRDIEFLKRLRSNLIPVSVAGNWWVDHRLMRPLPDVEKDADVILVAGWAGYKRHYQFFAALAKLRRQGIRLKTILVGYATGMTLIQIQAQARYWGVEDLIEWHENVPPADVNRLFNRAKVNVLWSRKEGFNRVIIEGMFAGVPCILRRGHNYGYRYRYINDQTGAFASERELPAALLAMVENHERYRPREWVMANMSCQRGTAILNDTIKAEALSRGEAWTTDIVVRVSKLNGIDYWDETTREGFTADYEFLRSAILSGHS
jgi:glycosyltransferase involved in cell wall biosynthesis